jgi:hypothetical protein
LPIISGREEAHLIIISSINWQQIVPASRLLLFCAHSGRAPTTGYFILLHFGDDSSMVEEKISSAAAAGDHQSTKARPFPCHRRRLVSINTHQQRKRTTPTTTTHLITAPNPLLLTADARAQSPFQQQHSLPITVSSSSTLPPLFPNSFNDHLHLLNILLILHHFHHFSSPI